MIKPLKIGELEVGDQYKVSDRGIHWTVIHTGFIAYNEISFSVVKSENGNLRFLASTGKVFHKEPEVIFAATKSLNHIRYA